MDINKLMKRVLFISIAFFLCITSLPAQVTLTLSEAVEFALRHKSDAVKARLDMRNAEYKIEEVRANALPQINANGSLTYNAILQKTALDFNGETTVIRIGSPWQATAVVQLDQQIFNMAVFQGLKAAKTTREFYLINAELTEEQIVEKVANSYYEVFKSKAQIKTVDSTLKNTTRLRDVLQSLFDNGLAKKIDLDRMNVNVNNIKSTRQRLQNAITLQENSLKYLIGMNIDAPVYLPENTFELDASIPLEKISGVEHRTEVQLMEKQGVLLRLNKKAIEANRYPTLALSANYGYLGLGDKFPLFAGKTHGVNWGNFSAIALNLRIPIFAGYSNRSKINQAEIEIQKFEADFNDTKLAMSLAIENAYTQISNALITLNTQKTNMDLARDVLVNIENNYRYGLATLTDVLDAENAFADAQNNYTAAKMDYKLSEVQLIKARGELKTYYLPSTKNNLEVLEP